MAENKNEMNEEIEMRTEIIGATILVVVMVILNPVMHSPPEPSMGKCIGVPRLTPKKATVGARSGLLPDL